MNDFFARIYEMFYYSEAFSADMFQESLYGPLGIIALVGGLVMMALFYYIINRPSFSKWYHWLIILGIHFAIQYAIGVGMVKPKFNALSYEYSSEYWTFALMHALLATLAYIACSFLFRWWSKNCKRTPIPN
jgi:hypothetical protein